MYKQCNKYKGAMYSWVGQKCGVREQGMCICARVSWEFGFVGSCTWMHIYGASKHTYVHRHKQVARQTYIYNMSA